MSLQSETGRKDYKDSDTSPDYRSYPKGKDTRDLIDLKVDFNRRGMTTYPGKGAGNPTGLGKVSQ